MSIRLAAGARAWKLETFSISRKLRFRFLADDLTFLLGQQQTASSLHKNIAYKPDRDKLSGVDEKSAESRRDRADA